MTLAELLWWVACSAYATLTIDSIGGSWTEPRVVAGVDNLLSVTDNLKTHNSTHHDVTDLTSVATEDNELPL